MLFVRLKNRRHDNLFGWNPPKASDKDYDTWDWGGNMIVHEMVRRLDGAVGVNVPASPRGALSGIFSCLKGLSALSYDKDSLLKVF